MASAVKYSNISPWKHVSESAPIVKTYRHFSSESEADELEYKAEIEESSDSVDTQHNYELNGKNFEFSEPECPTLPNVPEDSPWDILDHDELHENVVGRSGPELDDEILTRLTKRPPARTPMRTGLTCPPSQCPIHLTAVIVVETKEYFQTLYDSLVR